MNVCGAKTRSGEPCQRGGLENGRCHLHGGRAGRPPIHGRYSTKNHERLAGRIAEAEADPRPRDLAGELALCRALLGDFLDRFHRDPSADEIDRIGDMAERIARIAERAARIDNQTALTAAEVTLLQARLADIVLKYVAPPEREACAREIRSLASGAGRALGAG